MSGVDWDTWKSYLRELHFTRNVYTDSYGINGEPAYRTCERAKARVSSTPPSSCAPDHRREAPV